MKPFFIILICISFFSQSLYGKQSQPHLLIDPVGHSSLVRKAIFYSNGSKLISCSEDKSIKFWDLKNNDLIRTIYGHRGNRAQGYFYSIAKSPNEKILAAGGWFAGHKYGNKTLGLIRIYNIATGKVIHGLKGHISAVLNLKISNNGRYLASSSADKTVRIWDLKKLKLLHTLQYHKSQIYGLDISPDSRYVASGDMNGSLAIWDIKEGTLIKSNDKAHKDGLMGISFSPNGKYIATASHDKTVSLWSARTFKFIKTIHRSRIMYCQRVLFSKDSKHLLFGGQTFITKKNGRRYYPLYFYNMKQGIVKKIYKGVKSTIVSLDISKSGKLIAITSGNNHRISIINFKSLKKIQTFTGLGSNVVRTAWSLDSKTIYFDNRYIQGSQGRKNLFSRAISLESLKVRKKKINETYTRQISSLPTAKIYVKEFSLYNSKIYINNRPVILPIRKDGIRSYTLSPDGKYLIVGTNFYLFQIEVKTGSILGEFSGHNGVIHSVNVSPDSKYLVSGSSDQTIRIWKLNNFKGKRIFWAPAKMGANWIKMTKQYYPQINLYTSEGGRNLYDNFKRDAPNYAHAEFLVKKFPKTEPIVSIFISKKDHHLVWTPDFYYTGHKKLFKYVGWVVNKKDGLNADFYPFEQFDLKYNRPDIIFKRLRKTDLETIRTYQAIYKQRLKIMNFSENDLSGELHLPKIKYSVKKINTRYIKLKISASDSKFNLKQINIYHNNVPVEGINGIKLNRRNKKISYKLKLVKGINKIQVSTINVKGVESLKKTYKTLSNQYQSKPDLYIAVMGVSKYKNKLYNLRYADKDANNLISSFQGTSIYKKIHILNLNNTKGIKRNRSKIISFFRRSKKHDQVILFIAGHGLRDKNYLYYFATHDINFKKPSKKGLSFFAIDSIMNKIPSLQKIIIMDTCFSGEADAVDLVLAQDKTSGSNITFRDASSRNNARGIATIIKKRNQNIRKDFFSNLRLGNGSIIISSSSSVEVSYEGINSMGKKIKNGVFTYSIIKGIKNHRADYNKDKKIQVSEIIKFILKEVSQITKGKQTPTLRRENLEFDYSIY